MDAVEVNPSRDIQYMTAVLAGRLLHEGMGGLALAFRLAQSRTRRSRQAAGETPTDFLNARLNAASES